MALREEFEKSGNWLFRRRSYIPLLLLPLLAASIVHSGYRDGMVWDIPAVYFKFLAVLVSTLGLLIRCVTVGFVPRGTSGRNVSGQEASVLNTSGIYSLVRHPLYLGNALMIIGTTLYTGTWWCPLFTGLLFWLYYERIMFAEEEFLRRKFGDAYVEWSSRTPAFLPALRQWERPNLRFSRLTVMRREYSGLFGMISTFTILDLFERSLEGRSVLAVSPWFAAFTVSMAFYLVMMFLKKKTRLLRVEGR